ncbi:hypothetical protein [Virgibacillus halodenitrificans]|uniref:Uncharacterized protein n=2 Tax=Virgibacillus halodenitrificans TaxID=1482 RepID=A0AAC9IYD8_VIRHA|nr:hypothetical protein [Virgibacillus halodenitrificans]APC47322.1 hypothetical protein BME96_03685 [Virgibacillus halodenitrificans]MYL58216.1 hypothetical protein [Virgibacillus halodenitrificans]CDQ32124.1 hypothetical protein BN993_01528 [Virgibacillus halodenitrificans]
MKYEEASMILNKVGKEVILSGDKLIEKSGQGENYYQVQKTEKNWEYSLIYSERKDAPKKKVIKKFSNEEIAVKYFFLKQLSSHYYLNFVLPTSKNEVDFTKEIVKQKVSVLGIPSSYYDFKDKRKPSSIQVEKNNENNLIVQFIGNDQQIHLETLPLEIEEGYEVMYERIYLLYLLKTLEKELMNSNVLSSNFTDEDICVYL